jgi:hypothetical protein
VRDGANGALMTGEPGIVRVNVIGLDEPNETHKQHTEQSESPEPRGTSV